MSLATLFVFSVALADVWGQKDEKAAGDLLSGSQKEENTIHKAENYPDPF